MGNIIENRLSCFREALRQHEIDTFLVLMETNRRYLSGFTANDTPFDESAGALLITDKKQILLTDSRFELQAKNEAPAFDTVCYKESLDKQLPELLQSLGTKKLGFEVTRMTLHRHDAIAKALDEAKTAIELIGTAYIIEKQRVIKTEPEIDDTRKALSIAETVFTDFLKILRVGMTEKAAAFEIEKGIALGVADGISFPPICGFGPTSANPHAVPGIRTIQPGKPILFDWGAKVNGYCSDISRTVVIGQPDDNFKNIYQIVLDAQNMAINAIRAGAGSKAVDAVARDYIAQKGFKENFGHGLGHGTGLAIHEDPRLSPIMDTTLEAGMVITVEPGIYIPGWGGIRLENMVVVREDGAEVLNILNEDNFSHIIDL